MKNRNIDMIKGFAMVLSAGLILGCVTGMVWMGGEAVSAGRRKEAVGQSVSELTGKTGGTGTGTDRSGAENTEAVPEDEGTSQREASIINGAETNLVSSADLGADEEKEKQGVPARGETGELSGAGEKEDGELKNRELEFAIAGSGAQEGLSEEVLAQIEGINSGKPLNEVIGSELLNDYYALVATYDIVARDSKSKEEATGKGKLTLYIPNLLSGLSDVSALFYDKAEGEWKIIPAEMVDTDAKTVTVTLTGSGTMTVIYRRK